MDVKTFGLIFLGSILIQASIFGVVADKVPDKDGEVTKQGKEGNHLEEAAAVRAQSLNNVILKKRWTREENEKKKISKKSVIEEIPHLDDLSDLTDEINDRFATVEKRLAALEKQPPEPITPTLIDPTTSKPERKLVLHGDEAEEKNWDDARAECKRSGGDLATDLSEEEMQSVYSQLLYFSDTAKRIIWIGGRMNSGATSANWRSSFEWVDGGRISADDGNWEKDEPSNQSWKCMTLGGIRGKKRKDGRKGRYYDTYNCSKYTLPFLCQL